MEDRIASVFRDEHEMRRLIETINKIQVSIENLTDKTGVLGTRTATAIKDTVSGLGEASKGLEDMVIDAEAVGKALEKSFDGAERSLQRLVPLFNTVKAIWSGMGGMLGVANLGESQVKGALQNLSRTMPVVGPLIELMADAQFKEDKLRSAGRRAVMPFAGNEAMSGDNVRQAGLGARDIMQRLENNAIATRDEVSAVFTAFAKGGATVEQAFKPASFTIEGFGKSIAEVSIGVDKAFGQIAGTTSQFSQQLTRDTNVGITKSVEVVKNLGLAAQSSGIGFQAFLGNILQVTSALRVQGGDAEGLAKMFLQIKGTFAGGIFPSLKDKGEQNTRTGALAEDAMQSVAQVMQGMPKAFQAIIGKQILEGLGKTNPKALMSEIPGQEGSRASDEELSNRALRDWKTGFQRFGIAPGEFQRQALMGVANQAAQIGRGDDTTTARFLDELVPGMTAAFRETMIVWGKTGMTDTAYTDAMSNDQKVKDEAAKMAPLRVGDYERKMDQIQQVIGAIARQTFQLLMAIKDTIIDGISRLINVISFGYYGIDSDEFTRRQTATGNELVRSGDDLLESLAVLFNADETKKFAQALHNIGGHNEVAKGNSPKIKKTDPNKFIELEQSDEHYTIGESKWKLESRLVHVPWEMVKPTENISNGATPESSGD